jgi:hypothetical protein
LFVVKYNPTHPELDEGNGDEYRIAFRCFAMLSMTIYVPSLFGKEGVREI